MTTVDRRIPRRNDSGEGVISTVLAVLIMALLGVAMWLTFENIWSDTADSTEDQAEIIDSDTNTDGTG
ncbi:hypothetical protein NHL50_08605 [Acidimicrobiia bacterium EGI L10123]|uniref:hypothetical protein n=1 Tax=Salinilacustrithrix flava TaxID=2957203 RepID=UPI003D7C28AA|nr:hypothetical protein [Acidimicrobiia bacterium EGI L10123]